MAEDIAQPETDDGNDSLEFAAEQITALMGGAGTGEQPAAADPEPAPQAQAPAEVDPAPVATPVAAETAPVAAAPAPVAQAPAAPVAAQTAPAAPQAPAIDRLVQIGEAAAQVLSQRFLAQFPDIKTNADLTHLMRTDAGRYNEYTVAKWEAEQEIGRIGAVIQEHRQAEERAKQEQETSRAQAITERSKKIAELIPDLVKPDIAPKLSADITAYAAKNEIPPGRYRDATAGEVNVLYKAMLYDAAKAAEASSLEAANKKASKAPPVQQPGTRIPGNGKAEKMQESFTRLQKTGREDDAAAVFAQLLS